MARVTGVGGVFFRARDPKGLAAWYREHLGLPIGEGEDHAVLLWADDPRGSGGATVWSAFPNDTEYFAAERQFMINLRVDDLDGLLTNLRDAGMNVDEKVDEIEYGRFGWFVDPEGNRVELWEPR